MKKFTFTSLLGVTLTFTLTLTFASPLVAQDYDRSVVVEKDFQPIIQNAGKLKQPHALLQTELPETPIVFSQPDTSILSYGQVYPLRTPSLTFDTPDTLRGLIEGGGGHINSLLRFRYTFVDDKKNSLNLYANHRGAWGPKADEKTNIGFRFSHDYTGGKVFLNVFGANEFFTRYGYYYAGDKKLSIHHLSQVADSARQTLWNVGLAVGVQSNPKEDIQYKAYIQYDLLSMPSLAIEHHTLANLNFKYNNGSDHFGGVNFTFLGSFYSLDPSYIPPKEVLNRYHLRAEPFYEYKGQRVLVHVGANIDMNFGKGQILSNLPNVSFAPSPNVYMEAQIAPKWVIFYAQAKGQLGYGHSVNVLQNYRYIKPELSILSRSAASYSPIDAQLGFRFRLEKNLLLDVYGGYAVKLNMTTLCALPGALYFDYIKGNAQRGKIGLALSYHYQDIVSLKAYGDYFFWKSDSIHESTVHAEHVYDQANWKAGLDIEANIDSHWSIHSNNQLEGSRYVLVDTSEEDYVLQMKGHDGLMHNYKEVKLRPIININIGAGYAFDDRLSLSLDIYNLIHRYNDLYYGVQSRGINFVAAVRYRF